MRGLGTLLALALFGIGGPAVAGDMYNTPLRPSLVPNNGFTVGLIGGYDLGRVKVAVDPDALSSSLNGFDGGVLFGYDFENDGYFTAFELAGILGGPTKTYTVDPYTLTLGINGHVDARIRAGYRVAGGFGLSAIGGVSANNVSAKLSDGSDTLDESEWQFGWLVGVAADYTLTPRLSVGAEYTYNQLFDKTYDDAVKVGGSYHAFRLTTRLKI